MNFVPRSRRHWGRPNQVDITKSDRVEAALAEHSPSIVLNAAAYNQVDVAEREPQDAYIVNALAVRNVAIACRQLDARFVHFSTDYVFDGRSQRAYTESIPPTPWAPTRSRTRGRALRAGIPGEPLIIRTSRIRPGRAVHGPRVIRGAMLRLAAQGNPIRVVEDQTASPTYAPYLAERTADLVAREIAGIFHIGGGTPISWFEYARMIFRLAGVDASLTPTSEREYRTAARRPKYSALSNAKMESLGLPPMPRLENALQDYLAARSRAPAA